MTLGQREADIAPQATQPASVDAAGRLAQVVTAHRGLQHLLVPLAGHPVGQHARPGQARAVVAQAVHQRPEGAGHGAGVDHRQHRNAQLHRQVGRARLTIEQPHHPFDQDQVAVQSRLVQPRADVRLAVEPEVQVVHWVAAG